MKKEAVLIFMFALILSISFISVLSDFEEGDPPYSIKKQYPANGTIEGWINISFDDELGDSLFETNIEDSVSISLAELIKMNGVEDACSPIDCSPDYSVIADTEKTSKVFTLDSENSSIFGFKFTGDIESVSEFSMNISSNALESEFPQLYIDILNNGIIDWESYKSSGNFGAKKYGCFSSTDIVGNVSITSAKYCEKINLALAPNIRTGAYVSKKEESVESADFEISVEDLNGGEIGSCEATALDDGAISCISKDETDKDLAIKEQGDYHICIKAKDDDENKYKIEYEKSGACGFTGTFSGIYTTDYNIFIQSGKFDSIGNFVLDKNNVENLLTKINQYLDDRYENECGEKGCIIPVKFISKINDQKIDISNFIVEYFEAGTGDLTLTEIHNITESPAIVNLDFKKLYLDDANFSVGDEPGEQDFVLSFKNDDIIEEEIIIEKIPQIVSLNTRIVAAAYPTKFKVLIETFNSDENITGYEWDFFADGSDVKTTQANTVTYTYNSIGAYKLKVTVKTSTGLNSSKTFDISVKTPKDAVNDLLEKRLEDLNTVKTTIESLPPFHKSSLESILNLTNSETNLETLLEKNKSASSDQAYIDIMISLVDLDIPKDIIKTRVLDSAFFYSSKESINLEALKEIGGGTYNTDQEGDYINATLGWNQANNIKFDFVEYSTLEEDATKGILRIIELKLDEDSSRGNSYLIIPKLDNLNFRQDYSKDEIDEYVYISLTGQSAEIDFSTTEEINLLDLPFFISPSLSQLLTIIPEIQAKQFRTTLFVLILILLILIGITAYIILAKWYDKKYESHLFKNRNDLYNIVTYIHNAKKRGVKNKKIAQNLRKSKWSSEHINYVMKKYAGKRTGMLFSKLNKRSNGKTGNSVNKPKGIYPRKNRFRNIR